ncbi:RmlC-like cupin domain-containing protein [Melampsora americana]|nr:RmlC-like cupin domain-containing protein [Melampsora americana]
MNITRKIAKYFVTQRQILAIETAEGDGAVVRRSIGTQTLRNFDPFLMLDHFKVGIGAGFPDHPHRGQATVTYMLEGQFKHEDFAGHKGLISPGDLQWMIAGKGIVHAEMPVHETGGPDPTGLQLWIDLPKIHKMVPPQYQELKDNQIPKVELDNGVIVKVISGSSHGIDSPVRHLGGCWYFDIRLPHPSSRVFQAIPSGWNTFAYGLEGRASFGGGNGTEANPTQTADAFYTTILTAKDDEDGVEISNADPNGNPVRLVLIAGEPLNQPVVQYGPFVMTSQAEIQDAFNDYRNGRNGFEKAAEWTSTIGGR